MTTPTGWCPTAPVGAVCPCPDLADVVGVLPDECGRCLCNVFAPVAGPPAHRRPSDGPSERVQAVAGAGHLAAPLAGVR